MSLLRVCGVLVIAASACLPASAQLSTLPDLTAAPSTAINLLQNASFEDPDAGAWRFSDWPPRDETGARLIADSVRFTTAQAFESGHCLVFDLTTIGSDRTLIAQQRLSVDTLAPYDGETLRMSAKVLLSSGPAVQPVRMTMRQWGEEGLLDHHKVRLTADVNEWAEASTTFALHLGKTTRADVNVTVGQSPDLTHSPVVYVDDVRLDVLREPPLSAELPWGVVVMSPESKLPVAVTISQDAWEIGRRALRWDITGPDGVRSIAHGEYVARSRNHICPINVSDLKKGRYGLRLALGEQPGERWREVLLPFTRAEGPLGD